MTQEIVFHEDCVVKIKVDKYESVLRIIKFDESDKNLVHLRYAHPNRDILITLPIKALVYCGRDYSDYQKNFITTPKK